MERFSFVSVFVGFVLALAEEFGKYFADIFSFFNLSALSSFSHRRKIASILEFNLSRVLGASGKIVFKKNQSGYGVFFVRKDDMPLFLGNYEHFLTESFSMEKFLAQALSKAKDKYVTSYSSSKKGKTDCSKNLICGNADFAFSNAYSDYELDNFCSEGGYFHSFGNEFSNTYSTICFSSKVADYAELIPVLKESVNRLDTFGKEVALFFNTSRRDLYIEIFVGDIEKYKVKNINGKDEEIALITKSNSLLKSVLVSLVDSTLSQFEKIKFDYPN